MIPSLFPIFNSSSGQLEDGTVVQASSFCRKSIHSKPECLQHYDAMKSKKEGYYQCPFGLTSRNFHYGAQLYTITGVVAFPRFGTDAEQQMAKRFADIKVARATIEASLTFIRGVEKIGAAGGCTGSPPSVSRIEKAKWRNTTACREGNRGAW